MKWSGLQHIISRGRVNLEIMLYSNFNCIVIVIAHTFRPNDYNRHWSYRNSQLFPVSSIYFQTSCNKNAKDNNERTPLHIAVSQKHKRTVELLIFSGSISFFSITTLFSI